LELTWAQIAANLPDPKHMEDFYQPDS